MRRDGSTGNVGGEIRSRLGGFRVGCRREIEAVAAWEVSGDVDAVAAGRWRRKRWLVIASGPRLLLVSRPYLLPGRDAHLEWADLCGARLGSSDLRLTFGEQRVCLTLVGPFDELQRFAGIGSQHVSDAVLAARLAEIDDRPAPEFVGERAWHWPAVESPARPARRSTPELPSEAWELTAPESYVLRHIDSESSDEIVGAGAFKLAVTELVVRQALRLDSVRLMRGWVLGWRHALLLSDGPRVQDVNEPALVAVLDRYEWLRERRLRRGFARAEHRAELEGVLVEDLVASEQLRSGFSDYLYDDVVASLRRKGELSDANDRTALGRFHEQRLDVWMELGRTRLAHRVAAADFAWAQAYLAGAGSAVLLVASAYPALSRLCGVFKVGAVSGGLAAAGTVELVDGGDVGSIPTEALGVIDFSGLAAALTSVGGIDGAAAMLSAGFAVAGWGGDGGFG